jgi:hypothetical protein
LGIGDTSPAAPLDVKGTAETYTIYTRDTDNVCNQSSYGVFINKDISGSDTCTEDRTHSALRIDTDSSATGGDTNDEHRIYGIYNSLNSTGDSDAQYAAYNYVKAEPSSGTVSNVKGTYNYAIGDPDSGASVTNVYGVQSGAYAQGAGDITTIYGSNSWVNVDSNYTGSNISNAYGVWGEVEMDAAGTLDNAYGVQSIIDRNAGTITNGYLFHGDYQGTLPTNAYGVYIVDAVDNYFAGNVGIGVTPESWEATWKALQISNNGVIAGRSDIKNLELGHNYYENGGSKYSITDEAARLSISGGTFNFQVAPSGTADAAISWTTAMTIENDADVTIGTGNLVIGTAGKGIDFSAQTATSATGATTTSEILDSYEEGTWTPNLKLDGVSVGMVYGTQYGSYTKVGNRVTVDFIIVLTDKGSSSGNCTVTGLPFPAVTDSSGSNLPYSAGVLVNEHGGTSFPVGTYGLVWNDSKVYLRYNSGTGIEYVTSSNITDSLRIYMTVTYRTA